MTTVTQYRKKGIFSDFKKFQNLFLLNPGKVPGQLRNFAGPVLWLGIYFFRTRKVRAILPV